MNKYHRDPNNIDLDAPRLAWYKQKMWKTHQNIVYWVGIHIAQKNGFKFYQIRSNENIFSKPFCPKKLTEFGFSFAQ